MIAITKIDKKVEEEESLTNFSEGVVSMDLFAKVLKYVR
jgi:hypothetical protein